MTRVFKREITSCYDCPDYANPRDAKVSLRWCCSADRLIENINRESFPSWCPLPEPSNVVGDTPL